MIITILSNQQFDSKLKTNKWHVANQMAQKGHKVIFIDPPLRFKALKNINKIIEKKNDNLYVYHPINIFNFWPFSVFNTFIHLSAIDFLVTKLDSDGQNFSLLDAIVRSSTKSKVVLYIYHFDFPDLRRFMKKFKHDVSVYDCVDIYAEFPEYAYGTKVNPSFIALIQKIDDYLKIMINQGGLKLKSWVDAQEEWLCKNCDLVFASAPGIVSHLNKWRENVEYLPNAVEFEKFDHPEKLEEPNDLKNIPHPRVGFSGAIDTYKNNINLIEKCVRAYPSYHFVMIGPEKVSDPKLNLTELKKLSNIHFLGEKPWEETPAYFDHFDAYFIPYNLNDYTIGCHPIKYFESMAAGLPTLITLNSVKAFDIDNFVTPIDDQFVRNIGEAVSNDSPEKRKARKEIASKHSWSNKVNKQLEFINGKLNTK